MNRFFALAFAALLWLAAIANADAQILSRFGPLNPSNPAGTTATAPSVHMGLGATCQMVVQKSGIVSVTFVFEGVNNTAADGWRVNIVYGSGTPPTNGQALTTNATTVTALPVNVGSNNSTTTTLPFAVSALISGLSTGTLYWFDVSLRAVGGGTASIANVMCFGNEE